MASNGAEDNQEENGAIVRDDLATQAPRDEDTASPFPGAVKESSKPANAHPDSTNGDDEDEEEEEEEEEEEDDDVEPNLRYTKLTGSLTSVYRGGDSTSCFFAAADKMIVGSHNGNIHAFSLPSFETLRVYQAHSASVTAISVSPLPHLSPFTKAEDIPKPSQRRPVTPTSPSKGSPLKSATVQSPKSPRHPHVPPTPSNQIYIASASVDGHVCVASLTDPKDVSLRNYARPVQAVALSPDFKTDRTYLSGGLAGELILTVGAKAGVSANANTNSASAAATGWLSSIGLASNNGKDSNLHSGDGAISIIKWSRTGKYVVWVDEMGVNVMRTNLHLDSEEASQAWKRINLIDRPRRRIWEEMAPVWKARAEWIDEQSLGVAFEETDYKTADPATPAGLSPSKSPSKRKLRRQTSERVLVGWGDTVWLLQVTEGESIPVDSRHSTSSRVNIEHVLNLKDCVVSGLILYTPNLLLVLAYPTLDENNKQVTTNVETTPRRGIRRRQNGQPPEIRLIELDTRETIENDSLTVSRFESMSATDYHLSTVFVPEPRTPLPVQRVGALTTIGTGLWDMGASATRLFSSGASVLSGGSSGDKISAASPANTASSSVGGGRIRQAPASLLHPGLKIFFQSPFDCVLATKRGLSDRLTWLLEREEFQEAWELADSHPESITGQPKIDTPSSSPTRTTHSMSDFFDDDVFSQDSSSARAQNSAAEKEKRRIGELWLEQLVTMGDWERAGVTAGKVLGQSHRWEHWILRFTDAHKFDEITPYIPPHRLKPALPSSIYELVLDHYMYEDKDHLQDLIDRWDPQMFNISNVTSSIESRLRDGEKGDSAILLLEILAKLYLADAQPKKALNCYIRVQNADAALELIKEYQLLDSIGEDIFSFVLLRIPRETLNSSSLSELDRLSTEPIRLLVDGTRQHVIEADYIIDQLAKHEPSSRPFLFFYLRSLRAGENDISRARPKFPRRQLGGAGDGDAANSAVDTALETHADLIVDLYAEYASNLLLPFFKASTAYNFDRASQVCESRGYIPELVYLLSVTGQSKRALNLIIEDLEDASQAISFAKDCDDNEIWEDLLNYSMDKPAFIRVLLEEVGTAEGVDAVNLVQRIPEGLVIDGLMQGLGRILRDFECQWSICEGVARVLRSEVNTTMDTLNTGRSRGLTFKVLDEAEAVNLLTTHLLHSNRQKDVDSTSMRARTGSNSQIGTCCICKQAYNETEDDFLLGFSCGHIFHLACIFDRLIDTDEAKKMAIERVRGQLALNTRRAGEHASWVGRGVANKITNAQLIRSVLGDYECYLCIRTLDDEA